MPVERTRLGEDLSAVRTHNAVHVVLLAHVRRQVLGLNAAHGASNVTREAARDVAAQGVYVQSRGVSEGRGALGATAHLGRRRQTGT